MNGDKLLEILSNNEDYKKKKDEFLKKFNPWSKENAGDLIQEFCSNSNAPFSWLNIDGKLQSELVDIKVPSNIRYGVPNHVQGDFETAKLFVCLTNPNIGFSDKLSPHTLNEFYTYPNFKDNPDKSLNYDVFSKSTENVKHHIVNFDKEASILYKELYSSKNFDELYYSRNYFYHMLKNVAQRHSKKKNMKTNDLYNILKEYDLLNAVKRDAEKIVNLEAFPFRSKTPGKFGKEIVKLESDVILGGLT